MAATPELIIYGSCATPICMEDRVRRSLRGLDEGTLVMMCNAQGIYSIGGVSPKYPGLRIQEVEEKLVPGGVETTLTVSGLKTENSRRISLTWNEDPFGFDIANEERVESSTAINVAWGTALVGFSNMRYLGGGSSDQLDGRWMTRSLAYKGIRRTGIIHRRVTVNENIVAPSDPIVVDLPGGWPITPRKSRVSLPRVVCVETLKSTIAPATTSIPSMAFTPISGFAFPSVNGLSVNPSDPTYNYPYGWKLSSIESDQLYNGIAIYVHAYTYEYVWPKDF